MWASVKVEGRAATLPEPSHRDFYFMSRVRPAARLLHATLLVEPSHPLIGPLVERVVAQRRAPGWLWNTQDYASAVEALVEFQRRQAAAGRGLRVRAGKRVLWQAKGRHYDLPIRAALLKRLIAAEGGGAMLRLDLEATQAGAPRFSIISPPSTVPAVPAGGPADRGIQVERWCERYSAASRWCRLPKASSCAYGFVVSVPAERQFVIVDDPLPAGP